MKAIIDVAPEGAVFETVRTQLATGVPADYRLHFDSARLLLSHLTDSRMELLDTLRKRGTCSVYALAKACGRNYSNVHRDVAALETLGLIERDTNNVRCWYRLTRWKSAWAGRCGLAALPLGTAILMRTLHT